MTEKERLLFLGDSMNMTEYKIICFARGVSDFRVATEENYVDKVLEFHQQWSQKRIGDFTQPYTPNAFLEELRKEKIPFIDCMNIDERKFPSGYDKRVAF